MIVIVATSCTSKSSRGHEPIPAQVSVGNTYVTAPAHLTARLDKIDLRELKLDRTLSQGIMLASISDMLVGDSVLIVLDRLTDPHISIIPLAEGGRASVSGRHGTRVGSFVDPICATIASDQPLTLWLYDYTQHTLTRYQVTAAPGDETLEEFIIGGPTYSCVQIVNGRIFGLAEDGSSKPLWEIDRTGFTIRQILVTNGIATPLRTSNLAVRPDGLRMAVTYRTRSRIDFFHSSGEIAATTSLAPQSDSIITCGAAPANITYSDVTVTQASIFVILKETGQSASRSIDRTCVHEYNWNGRLLHAYWIKGVVTAIAVDKAGHELFAAIESAVKGPPIIVQFTLDADSGKR